jgi:hypothetical protein
MQDTLSEGTARAAQLCQLAPSAVTASAVGGSATSRNLPPVWLPTLSDDERLVEEHARSRGVEVTKQVFPPHPAVPSRRALRRG